MRASGYRRLAKQPLATSHLELVARVARSDLLHLGQRLQRAFGLDRVLAEWKLVIQMQVCVGRALAIAVGLRGIRKAQPDGGHVDRGVVQDVFVYFRGIAELAQRVRGIGLTERGGFADEAFRVFQTGKAAFRRLESAQAQLAHAGVVGSVRSAAATVGVAAAENRPSACSYFSSA